MSLARSLGLVLCVALTSVAAADTCQGPPSGEPGNPQVEFSILGALAAGDDTTPKVDSVAAGEVVLKGGISTPTPCYAIRAELRARADTLALTLVLTSQPVVCIQVIAVFGYRARIYDLVPGRYAVKLVATYPGTGWPPREEQIQVQIP